MKKIILSTVAILFVASAVLFASNTSSKKDIACPNTADCICPCTPDCQPGDADCYCPADCNY